MENANFLVLEDNVTVYQKADISSAEITKLNSGDQIMRDEKFKKHDVRWYSVFLPDDKKGYMRADVKGFKITLMVVKQPKVDMYEAPGQLSKIVFTYNKGDKFQVIGGVKEKYDNLSWIKAESFSGIIGYLPVNIQAKEVNVITPSEKWPMRIGFTTGFFAVAINILIYITLPTPFQHGGLSISSFYLPFLIGGLPAYFLTLLIVKLRRRIFG